MTFLIYAAIELIALAGVAWGIHLAKGFKYDGWGFILGLVCGVIAFIVILAPLCTRYEYNEFERSFEFLSDYYEAFNTTDIDNNYVYVIDIIEANHELAEWQGKHEVYGVMSAIPDRVMDISPIGLR